MADIQYDKDYDGDVSNIPNLTVVVRGNIYIDKDVEFVDGTYIAQPTYDASGNKDPNTGYIYTCTDGSSKIVAPSAIFSDCSDKQLTVTGTFMAERVVLNRTKDTIRDSEYRESVRRSKAAEVFIFSPDVYLSPPVFKPSDTPTNGIYEYISTLPPIL